MVTLKHAPCVILHHCLVAAGHVSMPPAAGDWPGYAHKRPDTPDKVVAVVSGVPVIEANILATGRGVRRWGVQVTVRGVPDGYDEAFFKANELIAYLEVPTPRRVQFETATYRIDDLFVENGPVYIGDEEKTRRPLFVVNCLLLISEA